jgi:hypothetical protein
VPEVKLRIVKIAWGGERRTRASHVAPLDAGESTGLLYSVAWAAACPRTDATAALAGATGRGAAGLETPLSIVSAEGISFTGHWRGFPTLRVPECKCNEANDCKSCEDDEHHDAVYESARLPSTCAVARAPAFSHDPCDPFSYPGCP